MISNKKIWISFVVLSIVLVVALSGCMRSNQPTEPLATPIPETDATTAPTATEAPTDALVQSEYDWRTRGEAVEKRINMFSEVADSRVIVDGETALVGVKFTNQYKGEITQRIRDMIAGEVKAADNRIQVVAVTAEPGDVATIFNLSDQMRSGSFNESELAVQMDKIVKNATTLR